jgi:hypothetical protein
MRCKICKTKFEPKFFLQKWCSPECGAKYGLLLKEKSDAEEWLKEKQKLKNKLKSYSQKLNEAKKVFQKWIRERDEQFPCISCGATVSNPYWDAGHFKKAELYRGVIFNELNVHKQCRKCNFFMDGNELEYRRGLVNRIGLCKVVELEELAEITKKYKYTDQELENIKNMYKL